MLPWVPGGRHDPRVFRGCWFYRWLRLLADPGQEVWEVGGVFLMLRSHESAHQVSSASVLVWTKHDHNKATATTTAALKPQQAETEAAAAMERTLSPHFQFIPFLSSCGVSDIGGMVATGSIPVPPSGGLRSAERRRHDVVPAVLYIPGGELQRPHERVLSGEQGGCPRARVLVNDAIQ